MVQLQSVIHTTVLLMRDLGPVSVLYLWYVGPLHKHFKWNQYEQPCAIKVIVLFDWSEQNQLLHLFLKYIRKNYGNSRHFYAFILKLWCQLEVVRFLFLMKSKVIRTICAHL